VDGLEKAGVLRRERSGSDRRAVLVSLTSTGRERLARKERQLARRRRLLYDRLDPAERAQSERLLRHLAELIGEL
jgi:DNA-binding MarR family transcriptional regulator